MYVLTLMLLRFTDLHYICELYLSRLKQLKTSETFKVFSLGWASISLVEGAHNVLSPKLWLRLDCDFGLFAVRHPSPITPHLSNKEKAVPKKFKNAEIQISFWVFFKINN